MSSAKLVPQIRCAIYTRKSTEEGLDQDFNSLDAQREAAEAYIQSQKHQGWTVVPQNYDDGGYTGANIDRPALKKLLQDIDAGRIQCVVVYKVDRLSRSLLDFARLMDQFDRRQVSFVSVTQQFNTTASLGRLTLNILLSFAQFEREIISERTRDKMSAARRRGKWTGGMPVLGYDVGPGGGRLIINRSEATQVQEIFRLFADSGSLTEVLGALNKKSWHAKSWTTQSGVMRRGLPFRHSTLRRLLGNPLYAGRIKYRDVVYAGEHDPIVDPDVWARVNELLSASARPNARGLNTPQRALLKGLILCGNCNVPMLPAYAMKRGRRYDYYLCRTARRKGWGACPIKSMSAVRIEKSVLDQLRASLQDDKVRSELGVSQEEYLSLENQEPSGLIGEFIEKVVVGQSGRVTVAFRRGI